jgi:hypothetical protein
MSDAVNAAWLRGLGAEALAALIALRSDAASPPVPRSLAELAERLTHPVSVQLAMRALDKPTLQVVEALAALGGSAARAELTRLLGAEPAPVAQAVDRLVEIGLATGGNVVTLVDAAVGAWSSPLGLGPPAEPYLAVLTVEELRHIAGNLHVPVPNRKAELVRGLVGALRNPTQVAFVLSDAPAPARALLTRVAATGESVPDHVRWSRYDRRPPTPTRWAAERAFLIPAVDWDAGMVMPAEVALALRGSGYTAPFEPVPPLLARVPVEAAVVARDSAAAAAAALRLVGALVDELGRNPLTTLKSGAIGVREQKRIGKAVSCGPRELRLALVLALQADLVTTVVDGGLAPTGRYDEWLGVEPAQRLAELVYAWWGLRTVPTGEAATGALDEAPALRALVLGVAAESDGAVASAGALAELVRWRRPGTVLGPVERMHDATLASWEEAGLLGLVGAGAISDAGRALLADDREALVSSLAGLGEVTRTVRIQADLTAVVAGTPSAELTRLLDAAAERESSGAASTWRFSATSVRRAFDAGHTADGLRAELDQLAAGGVPQTLGYLIGDVARRHGAVRVAAVASCLRSPDTALLAEIAADKRLRALKLRALAPTVLASALPLAETLEALRGNGYAPLAEAADGTAVVERTAPRRAATTPARTANGPGRAAPPRQRAAAPKVATAPAALAEQLLAAPDRASTPASKTLTQLHGRANLTDSELRILAYAIDNNEPVTIDYVNAEGGFSRRVIKDLTLAGDAVLAWCTLRDAERMFTLRSIEGVAPAQPVPGTG